jgi:hypothetical protein
LAHWPSPANPAGSNPTGQDLGRSNRPRPALAFHLSPLDSLSPATRIAAAAAWLLRLTSVTSAAAPWAKCSPPRPLPAPPNRIVGRFLSEQIGWLSPLGICCPRALRCRASPLELAELLSMLMCLSFASFHRWKRQVWCSRCISVKSSLDRA